MKSILVLALLFPIFSSYAATEITYNEPTPINAIRVGEINFFKTGSATQSEIINSLSKKADMIGGTHFVISSLRVQDNSYATAVMTPTY
ncbi:DUF1471 domain-containing protein [Enterobacter kobei]|uniref:DUF1471 domain-containing protein n=1 Tax=Enterobacter kobei TaxID=208224 RepID=UPI00222F187A|nr:DUF1471 domain-containing protein [Enterobacter kobei]MDM8773761.1 DUF1471 domain-containing protein [Enterobacter kobei]